MGGYSYGAPTSNNAPQPIPGGYGNPTGSNTYGGLNVSGGYGSGYNFPVFGPMSYGNSGPSANGPIFGSTNIGGLNSGFGSYLNNASPNAGNEFYKQLTGAYGSGAGALIDSIIGGGLFNPKVANAFLNAQQPAINRGTASIYQGFGAEGARFGSAAALGEGDYLSQVNLNEQQTLAQMYEYAQSQQLQLLEGTLPTLHVEQANKGGIFSDIIGGLEIAGGIALTAATAGAAAPIGVPLIAGGAGTLASGLAQGNSPGGTTSGIPFGMGGIGQLQNPFGQSGYPTGVTPTFGGGATYGANYNGVAGTANDPYLMNEAPYFADQPQIEQVSAGADFGGNNPFTGSGTGYGPDDQYDPYLLPQN